jgi:hypothetical protein
MSLGDGGAMWRLRLKPMYNYPAQFCSPFKKEQQAMPLFLILTLVLVPFVVGCVLEQQIRMSDRETGVPLRRH